MLLPTDNVGEDTVLGLSRSPVRSVFRLSIRSFIHLFVQIDVVTVISYERL